MIPKIEIVNWRPIRKNTMEGCFDAILPSGMILAGCQLHQNAGSRWIGLPGSRYIKANGTPGWTKAVDFSNPRARDRFQAQALAALDEHLQPGNGHG